MPEEDISLGGPDTHIPALDGDTAAATAAEETDIPALADETPVAEEATDAAQGDEAAATEAEATDDDALLQQFAKRTGLDPNNPGQRKTLDTLVAKEKFILELQGKLKTQEAADAAQTEDASLTEFEKTQAKAQADAEAAASKADDSPKMPTIGQYNDAGSQWQSPAEGYQALSKAWQHAAETGDMTQVIQTEAALYERRFDAIGLPKVQAMMEARLDQFLTQNFGEVMPQLKEQARAAQLEEAQDFAYKELAKTPQYKEIRSLDVEDQGQPLTVNGEQFRNTPLNRAILQNPWIMHIKREHADPKVADRLTYLARLKAAYSVHSKGHVDAATAKALVNAGSVQEQRKAQDAVRQSLNKGGTPSKALDKGGAKPKSYMEELMSVGEGPVSFSDL